MYINIYNGIVNDKNYLSTVEIPNYKQLKRIVDKLKLIKLELNKNDLKHNKIRYYIFKVNHNTILSEKDLINYGKKY